MTQHLKAYTRRSEANFTIELKTELSGSLREIEGNLIQLEQVLVNVLMNTIDAVEHEERKKIVVKTMQGKIIRY